jgi:hypothetical protein
MYNPTEEDQNPHNNENENENENGTDTDATATATATAVNHANGDKNRAAAANDNGNDMDIDVDVNASEPLFKYHRYADSDLDEIQQHKRITCVACHSNIIVFGKYCHILIVYPSFIHSLMLHHVLQQSRVASLTQSCCSLIAFSSLLFSSLLFSSLIYRMLMFDSWKHR